jgi:hypothetical protein
MNKDIKTVNNKLIQLAKALKSLSDEQLEKALINRAILDRLLLMRKNRNTNFELLERLSFRDFILLESYQKELENICSKTLINR